MISDELKNLVSRFGTLIIVENNQPKFVVMSYDKAKETLGFIHKSVDPLASSGSTLSGSRSVDNHDNFDKDINEDIEETFKGNDGSDQREEEIVDRLNKEILALKEQVAEKEKELTTNE